MNSKCKNKSLVLTFFPPSVGVLSVTWHFPKRWIVGYDHIYKIYQYIVVVLVNDGNLT